MVKEFLYKGKRIEELKKLNVREFAAFLPSRKKRSVLRQFDRIERFLQRCTKKQERGKPIRTHNSSVIIVPQMIDLTIYIYNGKEFIPVKIMPEMLGHYLGEFVLTRKKVEHGSPGMGATKSSAALSVK